MIPFCYLQNISRIVYVSQKILQKNTKWALEHLPGDYPIMINMSKFQIVHFTLKVNKKQSGNICGVLHLIKIINTINKGPLDKQCDNETDIVHVMHIFILRLVPFAKFSRFKFNRLSQIKSDKIMNIYLLCNLCSRL